MLTFRRFEKSDEEYRALAAIHNSNFPDDRFTEKEFKFYDEAREDKYLFERVIAEENDRIIAHGSYGHTWWAHMPHKFFLSLAVDPAYQGNGVSSQMYDKIVEALDTYEPHLLTAETRDDQDYILNLLAAKGFEQNMRFPTSRLDLSNFDFKRYSAVYEGVCASGIWIGNAEELATRVPDWQRFLWELDWQLLQDVPTPSPFTRTPFDQWVQRRFDSPNYVPKAYFVAMDGQKAVGSSALWSSESEPEKLYTGLTGVIRSHRRRGIATALKTASYLYAQEAGIKEVDTDNEENNPMYELNLQMGFQPKPALLSFELRLQAELEDKKEMKKTVP